MGPSWLRTLRDMIWLAPPTSSWRMKTAGTLGLQPRCWISARSICFPFGIWSTSYMVGCAPKLLIRVWIEKLMQQLLLLNITTGLSLTNLVIASISCLVSCAVGMEGLFIIWKRTKEITSYLCYSLHRIATAKEFYQRICFGFIPYRKDYFTALLWEIYTLDHPILFQEKKKKKTLYKYLSFAILYVCDRLNP